MSCVVVFSVLSVVASVVCCVCAEIIFIYKKTLTLLRQPILPGSCAWQA